MDKLIIISSDKKMLYIGSEEKIILKERGSNYWHLFDNIYAPVEMITSDKFLFGKFLK